MEYKDIESRFTYHKPKEDEIYYKLAEFEDFMEEQGFESLEELKEQLTRYKNAEEQLANGELSDGYHTFNELYEFRKLYNALLFNEWAKNEEIEVYKSKRHYDNEECFGGGWFIVVAMLPSGQISNHYELKDWDLFNIPEYEKSKYEFDGHTPKDVRVRMLTFLRNESCRILECEKAKNMIIRKGKLPVPGKLKEWVEEFHRKVVAVYPKTLLAKMQELELADLIRRKEK